MQTTIPVRLSKRKAREERLIQQFQALEDFANLGDTLDDVQRFAKKWPRFFPHEETEWIYRSAEKWITLSNLPDRQPGDYRDLVRRYRADPDAPITMGDWAEMARTFRREFRSHRPMLFFYRSWLRAVWRRRDPDGSCLMQLLGFDAERLPFTEVDEKEVDTMGLFERKEHPEEKPGPFTINGITFETMRKQKHTFAGLPYGTPVVDGNTGLISWSFGCAFQRAVYDLMQDRWRAMVCPECGKYFVADKTAQRYCSPECYLEGKGRQALDYYNRVGRYARQKAKALRAKSQRRKS